jgi:phosphotransferase system HPr (HPr) family protein
VATAAAFQSKIQLGTVEKMVDAKSILSLMLLAAPVGSELNLILEGADEQAAFNAIQLLLILPKRTVTLQTRRDVAGILADYFEKSPSGSHEEEENTHDNTTTSPPTEIDIATQQAHLSLQHQAADLERRRMQMPLEQLSTCIALMQKCGPLLEEDIMRFRHAIAEQMKEVK